MWQSVGFTHGVLNTDNMSLLGITIDYGPFGFMESYDSLYVPNSSDSEARYCYGRQIQVCLMLILHYKNQSHNRSCIDPGGTVHIEMY